MQTILLTALLFGAIMAAMSIGVIFSGRALRGSCGGNGENCSCDARTRRACAAAAAAEAASEENSDR